MNRHSRLRTPGRYGLCALAGQDPGHALGDDRLEQRAALGRDGRHRDDLVARAAGRAAAPRAA